MSETSALHGGDTPEYADELLTYLGDRDPLEVFAETESLLRDAVLSLDDATLRTPETEGKWSIIEVVQHLVDAEIVLAQRYRAVISEDNPVVVGFDQDAWAERLNYRDANLDEALGQFAAIRTCNLRVLRNIAPEDWRRTGRHTQRGPETLEHMVRLYAAHDVYHLYQIGRIRKAVG